MTEPQNMVALRMAHETKVARRAIRRQVEQGRMGVMSAIIAPCCHNMFVADVLMWQPQWAAFRADTLLQQLGFNPAVVCGSLTVRQRQQLSRMLRAKSDSSRDMIAWEEQQRWRGVA